MVQGEKEAKGKDVHEFRKRGKESSIVSISSLVLESKLDIDHERLQMITKRGELRVLQLEGKKSNALV